MASFSDQTHLTMGNATANYSAAGIHRFVVVGASRAVTLAGAGVRPDGVLQNKPTTTEAAVIEPLGRIQKIELGATVADGAEVASDATGRAITATTGDIIAGQVLTGGAVGEFVDCLTFNGGGGVAA